MSMRDNAFQDYGIVLNDIVKDEDLLQELADDDTVEHQFSFTGEAFKLNDDGTTNWNDSMRFDGDTVYYLHLPKRATLFKPAYRSMDALVKDMRASYNRTRKLEPRLPRLTAEQVRDGVRDIQGTYYG